MSGYVKLFNSILGSTVWDNDSDTRIVWVTMLAMADRDGNVEASVPGLAHLARVSREACERALACFLAPDPDSRTRDHEGRRIEAIDGGWRLLNHDKYKFLLSKDDQAERNAARQKRHRDRNRNAQALRVTQSNAGNDKQIQIHSQKPEAKKESAEAALTLPREHPDPEVQRLIETICSHAKLMTISPGDIRTLANDALPVGKRRPLSWLQEAARDAALDTPEGELGHLTQKRLRAYLKHAKAPRAEDTPNRSAAYREFEVEPGELKRARAAPRSQTFPVEPKQKPLSPEEQEKRAKEFMSKIGKGNAA